MQPPSVVPGEPQPRVQGDTQHPELRGKALTDQGGKSSPIPSGVRDTLWDAAEELFGIAQDLLWVV